MTGYKEYKDSDIYYLPVIPLSWKVLKAKYLFNQEKRGVRPSDEIITCFRDGQVTLRKNRRTDGFTNSEKEIGYQGVRKGDLVIHNMDAFAGSIGVSDSDGKSTPVYSCCTPKRNDINPYYYCYLLRALARSGFILSLAKGIRERSTDFRFNDFKELLLPVPPIEEQRAMVEYLDKATARIDNAIVQQQRMIDLLNERKQIIIQKAVTKGLDPNVPMKDSGIDWIGNIPEHWSVMKIRNFLEQGKDGIKIGPFGSSLTGKVDSDYPFKVYGQWNITSNDFNAGKNYVSKDTFNALQSYLVVSGDILVSMMGTVGKCAIVPENICPGIMDSHVIKIRLNKSIICNEFFVLAYDKDNNIGTYDCIQILKKGSIMDGLNSSIVKEIKIALPPTIDEQKSIVDYINVHISPIDHAVSSIRSTINLLQERKQIIINEVVTGKVKVM